MSSTIIPDALSLSLPLFQHNKPLYSFEDNADYVYDVMWSPVHPALFAAVDGMGRLDLWNLNNDTEVCVCVNRSLWACFQCRLFVWTCVCVCCSQGLSLGLGPNHTTKHPRLLPPIGPPPPTPPHPSPHTRIQDSPVGVSHSPHFKSDLVTSPHPASHPDVPQ